MSTSAQGLMVAVVLLIGLGSGEVPSGEQASAAPTSPMQRCLDKGTPDALERRVPACRTAIHLSARAAQALRACLGSGTPDAIERRIPGCRPLAATSERPGA